MLLRKFNSTYYDHLNSNEPCIQLMMEKESDGQLPFLDILLNREEDGSIGTSVHRKATHTDQYLCFHSHQPIQLNSHVTSRDHIIV